MSDHSIRPRLAAAFALFLLFFIVCPAQAAVEITFFSKELSTSFPHAFVVMDGMLADGTRVDEDYGFTAKTVSPAILMGAVKGEVVSDHDQSYVRRSDRHFTLTISDAEFARAITTIERWRTARQPSYRLGSRNCVHFVAEIAASIGLIAEMPKRLMKKPRSYLEFLTAANRELLQRRGAIVHRAPA